MVDVLIGISILMPFIAGMLCFLIENHRLELPLS